jgi:hypothetical protein
LITFLPSSTKASHNTRESILKPSHDSYDEKSKAAKEWTKPAAPEKHERERERESTFPQDLIARAFVFK